MITKNELAYFIRRVAHSECNDDEWQKFAVAHYADEQMEKARRDTVKLSLEKASQPKEKEVALLQIARCLES